MPSTIPELNLGGDSTMGAAAFADIVLDDNTAPFGGAVPGAMFFGVSPADVQTSNDASFSASSWEHDDMLADIGLYSVVIKHEPIDSVFPSELSTVNPAAAAAVSSNAPLASTSVAAAAASTTATSNTSVASVAATRQRRLASYASAASAANDDDEEDEDEDEEDEDEDEDDEDELDDDELDDDAAARGEDEFDEPSMQLPSVTTIVSTVGSGAFAPRTKKAPASAKKAGRSSSQRAPARRAAGRPSRAASAAAAVAENASDDSDDLSDSGDAKPTRKNSVAAAAAAAAAAAKLGLKRKAASQQVQLSKSEQELAATLELSRDELLNMTSDSLEVYAQRLASARPLTVDEQKKFKRQRRLIKNRESAQLSRMRKKAYVDELEKQIADLNEDKEKLRRRFEAQARELDASKTQVAYLRSLLGSHPALAQLADRGMPAAPAGLTAQVPFVPLAFTGAAVAAAMPVGGAAQPASLGRAASASARGAGGVRAAGLTLLLALFSLGLLFTVPLSGVSLAAAPLAATGLGSSSVGRSLLSVSSSSNNNFAISELDDAEPQLLINVKNNFDNSVIRNTERDVVSARLDALFASLGSAASANAADDSMPALVCNAPAVSASRAVAGSARLLNVIVPLPSRDAVELSCTINGVSDARPLK